jgi:hypothetical protein
MCLCGERANLEGDANMDERVVATVAIISLVVGLIKFVVDKYYRYHRKSATDETATDKIATDDEFDSNVEL